MIEFSNQSMCLGRNGYSKTKGLDVFLAPGGVILTPVNSKGNLARCEVFIPKEKKALMELAKQLNQIAKGL
jgi:hypothetical protein